jgi:hypothetical protein
MPPSFNKDKLSKKYYKCIKVQRLQKNNGDSYLKLRLMNSNGIIDAYLWDMVSFYERRINQDGIYAVKAKEEVYNDNKVLNIKNINSVAQDRYDKYSYISKDVELSSQKVAEYHYNELINLISMFPHPVIKMIHQYFVENKDEVLFSNLIEHKRICIKHVIMLDANYRKKINQDLCIVLILIDRLEIDSLIKKIKKIDTEYYSSINSYSINDKEFIKKYKYIVDLIRYNFNNEKFFKTN